jgi:hypothetical protein
MRGDERGSIRCEEYTDNGPNTVQQVPVPYRYRRTGIVLIKNKTGKRWVDNDKLE